MRLHMLSSIVHWFPLMILFVVGIIILMLVLTFLLLHLILLFTLLPVLVIIPPAALFTCRGHCPFSHAFHSRPTAPHLAASPPTREPIC